jgi:ribosomal protein S13
MRRDGLIDDSFIEIWHQNINKELKVNSYRGTRHRKKYPIKGRTRSNANTRKRWKITS